MPTSEYILSGGNSTHLSNFASSYCHDPVLYTAEIVAPVYNVEGLNFSFKRNNAGWSDKSSTVWTRGQKSSQLDAEQNTLVQDTVAKHGLHNLITEDEFVLRGQSGESRNEVLEDESMRLTGALMTNREVELAEFVTNANNYDSNHKATPSTKWDNASGKPSADIMAAIAVVAKGPAKAARNYMVASEQVWYKLLANPEVRAACGGLSFAADFENIGRILGVIPVIAKASADGDDIFGKSAVIFRRPENVGPKDKGAQCSFRMAINNELPVTISENPDESRDGIEVIAKSYYKIFNPYADKSGKFNTAFLLQNVIS